MKRVLLKSFGVLLESLPLRRGEGLKRDLEISRKKFVFRGDELYIFCSYLQCWTSRFISFFANYILIHTYIIKYLLLAFIWFLEVVLLSIQLEAI